MSVRARRAASPTPGLPRSAPQSQRFPHPRAGHLDADEKREAASRGFGPSARKQYPPGGVNMTAGEWKLLGGIVIITALVRFFRISEPNSVVFDEVHFGKFASRYIKTQYFMDVHPPLAKLLITLAAFMFGYDGNFDFKDIAKPYESSVPYVAMRMVPATMGVATVPLAYLTMRALDLRATTALLASLFLAFENAMVTQSRHILLDSPLIFFTALSTFLWVGFSNEDKHKPFTKSWWTWLFLSGLSLGAVLSCKWVGLFTIATVGVSTILQLWNILGDVRVPPRIFVKHFMARALCLIVLPIIFYMTMFSIHFAILGSSGEGDGFMSSEFQHTLSGRGMDDTFADVALGSEITLRHVNTQGGYLHSHASTYPGGSMQQQITLYPHRDDNNLWRIMNATFEGDREFDWEHQSPHYIENGMRIKLFHLTTEKHLHSHDHRPPVSDVDFQNEVSAYGMPGFSGDANDDWIVEIHHGDKSDPESSKRLRTLKTHFRLRHVLQGCYLFSHKVKLPEWGFEQQEVTCNKNAVLDNSLWYVETSNHVMFPDNAPRVNYKLPGFFGKFFELQQVMWTTNQGLTDRHTYDSRPDAWPRLRRGINFWVKDHRQIYLIGNPWVWMLSTLSVVAYVGVRGLLILRAKRGFRDFDNTKVVKYDALCGFLFAGWSLHYLPFFLMGRQLFLHHYLPALYFAILLSCAVFDLLTATLRPRVRLQIAAVLAIIAIWNFAHFSPLAYGNPWTKAQCKNAKWLKHWDFSCDDFLDDYSMYWGGAATPKKSPSADATKAGELHQPPIIEDAAAQQQQLHDPATIVPIGQAEPGRDVFAGDRVGDIKASDIPPTVRNENDNVVAAAAAAAVVDKEISSVVTGPLTTAPAADNAHIPAEEQAKQAGGEGDNEPPKDPVAEGVQPQNENVGVAPTAEQGPLEQHDMEADRVAADLYPSS